MNFSRKYRITMEDESSLEKKVDFSIKLPWMILLLIGLTVLAGAFGMFILASTPMKKHLPGYLKDSERTATEQQHMRLDSLVHVYEINEAYVTGILNALSPQVEEANKQKIEKNLTPLSIDSLLPESKEEKEFVNKILNNKQKVTISQHQ